MYITFLSLSPQTMEPFFSEGVLGRAVQEGRLEIRSTNIRDFATDKHRVVDDSPYGGGAGMLLKPDIVALAIENAQKICQGKGLTPKVILTSPRGRPFNQATAQELSAQDSLIFVCGQYEGIDQRISDLFVDMEISLGDFVLSGGEIAACAIANSICRLLPGMLGDDSSALNDSFSNQLLEYPQYTRPPIFRGYSVPSVLLSGNHEKIAHWRWEQSFLHTASIRPDMLRDFDYTTLNKAQLKFVSQLRKQLQF